MIEETPATTGNATGQEPPANGGTAEQQPVKTFTQAEVDELIRARLDRQRTSLEAAQAKAKQEADAAALAQQGEFKTLAEQRQARIAELEPQAERATRLEKALQAQLDEAMKGVPDYILPLLEKLDVIDRLEYLAKNRAALVPVARQAPETDAGGRGGAQPDPKQREAELRARYPSLGSR